MTSLASSKRVWKRSRYGFVLCFVLSVLAACFVLRVALLLSFGRETALSAGAIARIFLIGFYQDLAVALILAVPLLFWLWIIRDRWFGKLWQRVLFVGGFLAFWTVLIFLLFAEYYFFEEFRSRFNTVAVDYLLYPHEVFINIRDSYPVGWIVSACAILSAVWAFLAFSLFHPMWYQPSRARTRFFYFAGATTLCVLVLPTIQLQGTHFSSDRTLNQIANNGSIAFVNAAWTGNLDYAAYYRTISRDEAAARARKLLASPRSEFVGDRSSLRRKVAGDSTRPRLNVVILLEESLGSEFWGSLGSTNAVTPEMDRLATEEGMLFSNIYACGNRTIRGFEGVLSSFPPLPGDSIVRRNRSENIETVARVLKRDGYDTVFLYGGRGLFDGMRSYALNNGWDRFIEQKDFARPTFTSIWGVCDEDIFGRAIEEFRKLADAGKPFLGTVLSVSNHKPYTYPKGRIPENPDQHKRSHAVKYSDWSLGQFFRQAKKESFWTNTVFVVVADHGARVYGRQTIPIYSYEIPLVILGPAVVNGPQRIGTLGNSLDVSPTILGMIGRPYETMFFGRDILNDPPEGARALLNHNRDIGMFAGDRMVVLSLQKAVEYYQGNPKVMELKPITEPTPGLLELEKDAIAIYQMADSLYMNREYRIDGTPPARSLSPTAQVRGQKTEAGGQKTEAGDPPFVFRLPTSDL